MLASKREVDQHVSSILGKIKTDDERNLRGFNFARHYYNVKEYETAKRYLSGYLSLKETSAPAHKLMGQIFEQSNHLEKALQSYKRSLELDGKQKDIVLKICEFYCKLPVDPERARYWADRAEKLHPYSEVVFKLRESLVCADGNQNTQELEELISNGLIVQPRDVSLRVKLLKLYLDTERVKEAYEHAIAVEKKQPHRDSLEWYYCLTDVFDAYLEEEEGRYNERLCVHLLTALDRLVYLNLKGGHEFEKENRYAGQHHQQPPRKMASAAALQALDQHLHMAKQLTVNNVDPWKAFLSHMEGQLVFHMATVILKRVKQDHGNQKEASRMGAALLLAAYFFKPLSEHSPWFADADQDRKSVYVTWKDEACYRLSQAGYTVIGMCREERSKWLGKIRDQVASPQTKEKIFQRVFNSRGQQQHQQQRQISNNSYFMNCDLLAIMSQEFPDPKTLLHYDFVAHTMFPDSLHHLVWLALQQYNIKDNVQPTYGFVLFPGLQYSTSKLDNPAPESLCLLDVEAFLYATVRCSALAIEENHSASYVSPDTPTFLPANISDELCSSAQSDWWRTAYLLFSNKEAENLGDLRRKLQHGIEVIRAIGNHGLDVSLVVHLANTFADRSSELRAQTDNDQLHAVEISELQTRAGYYWQVALSMLERLSKNLTLRLPRESLFPSYGRELSTDKINSLMDDGRFFLACQAMNDGRHDEAIAAFETLRNPYASFYQALTYKKLAAEEFGNTSRESITSEMRSRHIILLTRARDALYVTLDRVRGDRKHPLNQVMSDQIEDIETRLARIDPDTAQRNEFGGSDGSYTQDSEEADPCFSPVQSFPPTLDNSHLQLKGSLPSLDGHPHDLTRAPMGAAAAAIFPPGMVVEPRRARRHQPQHHVSGPQPARPSPERLDAQIRSLTASHESVVRTLVEQNRALLETNRSIAEGLQQNREVTELFTAQLERLTKAIDKMQVRPAASRRRPPAAHRGAAAAGVVTTAATATTREQPATGARPHDDGRQPPPEEEDEDYYDGYYYDEEEEEEDYEGGNHENQQQHHHQHQHQGDFRQNPAYNYPTDLSLHGDFQYGQTAGPIGAAAIGYPPHGSGRGIPPLQPQHSYPSFYPPPPGGVSVPGIGPPNGGIIQGHPHHSLPSMPPSYFQANPSPMFSGLPFSEGQSLPEFHFSLPPGMMNNSATDDKARPPIFPQLGLAPLPKPIPVPDTSASGRATTEPVRTATATAGDSVAVSSPASGFQFAPATTVSPLTKAGDATTSPSAHSFQIALPEQAVIVSSPSNILQGESQIGSASSPTRERHDSDRYNDDDCSGGPDFKPIIPLPAEVEVRTGEEDEAVLFEDRAKLFRFAVNEWKERGVGIVKILHHEASGRVRLLMRRDQIHKVCANHSVLPDMELTPMKKVDKAWLWAAMDFADEKVRPEQFCIRFKTVEIGQQFKKQFDLARDIAAQAIANKSTTSSPTTTDPVVGFGDKFKPKACSWSCATCYVTNDAVRASCVACETPGPAGATSVASSLVAASVPTVKFGIPHSTGDAKSADVVGFGDKFKPKSGSWTCSDCYVTNDGSRAKCVACDAANPYPPSAGDPITTKATSSFVAPQTTVAPAFKFGVTTVLDKPTGSGGSGFSQLRAALDQPPTTQGFKFGLASTTAPPLAVTLVTTTTTVSSIATGGSALTTQGFKFGLASTTAPPLAVTLVTTTTTVSSIATGGSALTTTSTSSTQPITFGGSPQQFAFGNGSIFGGAAPAPAETAASGFVFGTAAIISQPTSGYVFGASPIGSDGTAVPATSSSGQELLGPASRLLGSLAAKKQEDGHVPNAGDQKFLLGGFSFKSSPVVNQPTSTVETEKKDEPKKTVDIRPFANFSFTSPPREQTPTPVPAVGATTPKSSATAGKPRVSLGVATNLLKEFEKVRPDADGNIFSSMSKGFTDTKAFQAGASSANWATSTPVKVADSPHAGDAAASPEFEPNVDFKPVVPLPELVAVKTGEEEEEKLFGERAKLFRYIAATKEWKERGLGEIKLLRHLVTRRVRLLMRREQVLKICANHYIDASTKLQPMAKSDRAWVWFANDFSEGELHAEQFAIKFRDARQAAAFRDAVESAQLRLADETATTDGGGVKPDSLSSLLDVSGEASTWECDMCHQTGNVPTADKCKICHMPKPGWKAPVIVVPKSSMFSPRTAVWVCAVCRERNAGAASACGACTTSRPGENPTTPDVPLSELFKPKSGSWECGVCYVRNDDGVTKCSACEMARPGENATPPAVPLSELFKPKTGSWECGVCYVRNDGGAAKCSACETVKPGADSPGFKFGFQPSVATTETATKSSPAGFRFSMPEPDVQLQFVSSSTPDKKSAADVVSSSSVFGQSPPRIPGEFRFGTPTQFTFNFGGVRPKSPVKTPKSPGVVTEDVGVAEHRGGDGSSHYDEEDGDSEGDSIYFKPVVPLPELVPVTTGEEGEDVLYSQRAKLYRLADGEWRERGLGDFKILLNRSALKVRLLMRREQILKVCLNHYLTPELLFAPKDDKSWVWCANDFADQELRPERLALRFKTPEIAEQFKRAVDHVLDLMARDRLSEAVAIETAESRADVSGTAVTARNFSFTSAAEGGSPQVATASPGFSFGNRFGPATPTSVSVFGGTSPAVRKEGGNPDIEIVMEKACSDELKSKARDLMLPPNFYSYEKSPACPGCRGCDDEDDVSVVWELQPTEDQIARAAKLLLPPTFFLYENKPACPGCIGCDDDIPEHAAVPQGDAASPVVGVKSILKQRPVATTSEPPPKETKPPAAANTVDDRKDDSIFAKAAASSFSFASLAAQTTTFIQPAATDKMFKFAGSGAQLFKEANDGEGSGDEDNDDSARDPHFEPIIPLPSLIELKTGEEDEDKLFGDRCKLYRFDTKLKQWKERGIGELKVLEHRDTHKFRLLMRREQVHKIVCNHLIGADLNVTQLTTNESSMTWTAVDFSDEQQHVEKFAVRFKTPKIAQEFQALIHRCQSQLNR